MRADTLQQHCVCGAELSDETALERGRGLFVKESKCSVFSYVQYVARVYSDVSEKVRTDALHPHGV